jgi:hypothetical protein
MSEIGRYADTSNFLNTASVIGLATILTMQLRVEGYTGPASALVGAHGLAYKGDRVRPGREQLNL